MYDNRIVNWSQLISMTSSGLQVADYVKIRQAVTERFKEIYGDDIDVSTASADGVYLENYCLIINNILQGFKTFYANLDVSSAVGKSLDVLAALSNIYRKSATHSTASLEVTLNENESDYTVSTISFLDGNGNVWTCNASDYQLQTITFEPGVTKTIAVVCEELGPIVAEAGWIDRLVNNEVVMEVVQSQNASIGKDEETDIDLRERRNDTVGSHATTVLEALAGALYKIDGIEDVKIYNNNTNSSIVSKDYVTVPSHSVYILTRYSANTTISDNLLGTLIYERMTPGIPTTEFDPQAPVEDPSVTLPDSTAHSFTYTASYLGDVISLDVQQLVYWTEVEQIHPSFKVIITPNQYFATSNNSTANLIGQRLINFANNLKIGKDLMVRDIDDETLYADPLFRGRHTFTIKGIQRYTAATNLDLTDTLWPSNDQCFNYSNVVISTSGNDIVITIS